MSKEEAPMMRETQKKTSCADSTVAYYGGEHMRKKVYDHIAENPGTTVQRCARALSMAELSALSLINELCRDGIVSLMAFPLGNDIKSNNSPFYAVYKPYIDRASAKKRSNARASTRQEAESYQSCLTIQFLLK